MRREGTNSHRPACSVGQAAASCFNSNTLRDCSAASDMRQQRHQITFRLSPRNRICCRQQPSGMTYMFLRAHTQAPRAQRRECNASNVNQLPAPRQLRLLDGVERLDRARFHFAASSTSDERPLESSHLGFKRVSPLTPPPQGPTEDSRVTVTVCLWHGSDGTVSLSL